MANARIVHQTQYHQQMDWNVFQMSVNHRKCNQKMVSVWIASNIQGNKTSERVAAQTHAAAPKNCWKMELVKAVLLTKEWQMMVSAVNRWLVMKDKSCWWMACARIVHHINDLKVMAKYVLQTSVMPNQSCYPMEPASYVLHLQRSPTRAKAAPQAIARIGKNCSRAAFAKVVPNI